MQLDIEITVKGIKYIQFKVPLVGGYGLDYLKTKVKRYNGWYRGAENVQQAGFFSKPQLTALVMIPEDKVIEFSKSH